MISFVRRFTIKGFSLAMILLLGICIANKGINTHSHKLENGTVVTHAHPYNKAKDSQPFKTHHHTSFEFLLLEGLNVLFLSTFLILISLIAFKIIRPYFDRKILYFHLSAPLNFGRAPPIS